MEAFNETVDTAKLIEYLEREITRLARLDLTKGGMDAGYAVAVITIKGKVEDGEFATVHPCDSCFLNQTGARRNSDDIVLKEH